MSFASAVDSSVRLSQPNQPATSSSPDTRTSDRKSTRLNSSHSQISYAVFCLKKKFNLSQSPMLGFHKQMDNRIKLLGEILSFRMQGVEFDNGDMYVDGHKAASDVRDEFVSVTEKLMDELAQCYNFFF